MGDSSVDSAIAFEQQPVEASDQVAGPAGKLAGSSRTRPYSSLPSSYVRVLSTLTRFRQMTSSQVRRLHFTEGSERGRIVRTQRCLSALHKRGFVGRVTRAQGGHTGGSGEYVWQLPASKARMPDMHTLDITELYVSLVESGAEVLAFRPEPWSYTPVGNVELKPDAYARVQTGSGTYQYFIEVDRGTEYRPQLATKMRHYVRAFHEWEGDTFPEVVWVVPDDERLEFVASVIRRQREPLFTVVRFDRAVEKLMS
jgi:hypothetical protein